MFIINLKKFLLLFSLSLLFFFISLDKAHSTPYCDGKLPFNPLKKIQYPKKIDIKISNSRKWYKNYFNIVRALGSKTWISQKKIKPKLKSNFMGDIKVYFMNDVFCDFKAKIKIQGSRGQHIDEKNPSLSIKLIDGHINNNSNFLLFVPRSRENSNEILITTLSKDLKLLSPNTFFTDVKINDQKTYKYIFQEEINSQFLRNNNKRDNIVLLANKSRQIYKLYPNLQGKKIQLSRFYNDDDKVKIKNVMQGIDSLNYHMLENVRALKENKTFEEEFLLNAYALDTYNFIDYKKNTFNKNYINFSIYDALMIASGAIHGVNLFDRKYSYDVYDDQLYPIYYDGMAKILDNNLNYKKDEKYKNKKIFKNHKLGLKYLKNYFANYDLNELEKKLKAKNLQIKHEDLAIAISNLKNNIDFLLNLDILEIADKPNYNYFKETLKDKKNLKLAFEGQDNIFSICDVNMKLVDKDCKIYITTKDETLKILSNQITKTRAGNLFYVRNSLKNYLNNSAPAKYGLDSFFVLKINGESKIYYKMKNTKINIILDKKVVNIESLNPNERTTIVAKKLNGWTFKFNGGKFSTYIKNTYAHPRDSSFQGCLTFLNSNLTETKILLKNANCPNALHFVNTKGSISEIEIENVFYDAVDADNSDLIFEKIVVRNSGQECLGLKTGKYLVKNLLVSNCKDKALSVGENATLKINNLDILNSKYGLVSKDSGSIFANNAKITNSQICLAAYRNKLNFEGGYVSINNIAGNCNKKNYEIEKGSVLNLG